MPIKKLVKRIKRTGTKARKPVRMVSKAAIGAGKVASAFGARGVGRKVSKAGRVGVAASRARNLRGAKLATDRMRSSTGR